jgi:oligoendopeptidase F
MELSWDLKELVKDDKEFNYLIKKIESSSKTIDQFKKKLSPGISKKDFLDLLLFEDDIGEINRRVGAYVSLLGSLDTKSQKVMKLTTILEELSIKFADKIRPISFWLEGLETKGIKKLDDKNAKRLFDSVPKHYHFSLYKGREDAKHTLPEEIERTIHRKDMTGVNTLSELYDKITTNFTFKFKPKGEKEITYDNVENLKKHIFSPKKEHRKAAYNALFTTYSHNKETLFTIYASILKNWSLEAKERKYKSPINCRNNSNDFSDKAVEVLLKVCKKNAKTFQEFFKIKAKLLGMKKLDRTDLYAPLTKDTTKWKFEQAKDTVMTVFNNFDKDFNKKANIIFNKNHIDSHPKTNKRTGAFCMYVNSKTAPYVLLNFVGQGRDISTLAHELGHGIHDLYISDLPVTVAHPSIPLAETASTFAEMILFEELLKKANKEKKKILLSTKILDSYATIIRQAYFVDFEIKAHNAIPKGMTEEELSEMYFKSLKEQYGTSINLQKNFKYEWSYIPHIFHTPFYCYAYSFGELLSLALYANYKKQGKEFIPKLKHILKAGGSVDPEKLLKEQGFNIRKEEFWQQGFKVIENWIKEFKTLL